MSREILFKGKSLETGKWIQGGYFKAPHSCFISETVWENEKKWSQWARAVDPSTVCQYTGLKDRADKMIFENDIVKIAWYPDLYGWVRFGSYSYARGTADTNYGWFVDFTRNNDYYRQDFGYWIARMIVVGNFFDTPELLGGENECLSQD